MTNLLNSATGAIAAAKANPLALVALITMVVAWLILAFRIRRNAQLLAHLGKLPEKDRLKALELEMGHVPLKTGLSPEQWLRHRVHTYYFFGFALFCLFLLIFLAIAKFSNAPELKTGASISLHDPDPVKPEVEVTTAAEPPRAPAEARPSPIRSKRTKAPRIESSGLVAGIEVSTKSGPRQMAEDRVPSERVLSYAAEIDDGMQHFRYHLLYLDLFRRGGPIQGFNPLNAMFKWRYPEIAINVVNNTKSMMLLSQAVLTVEHSLVDETPLLLVEDYSLNDLVFHNEGWGNIGGGTANLTIQEMTSEGDIPMFAPAKSSVSLGPFTDIIRIPLPPLLPTRLRDKGEVKVSGTLDYESGRTHAAISFDTHVSLHLRVGAGVPASHSYHTFFQAGKAPVRIPVDIAQQIAPGAADRFYILLGTDKTCQNHLRVDFRTAGGEIVPGHSFVLDIFVPRSAAGQYPG
jgi:hypothetical protein